MRKAGIFIVLGAVAGYAPAGLAAKKEVRDVGTAKAGAEGGPAKEGKEEKERAAKRACLNGEAAKGVALLTDLYVDTNDPTYIFNQGRCFEQNDRCEEAIVRFREYLRKTPEANERDRGDAQKHIDDCQALLTRRLSASSALAAGQPSAAAVVPSVGGGAAVPGAAIVAPAPVGLATSAAPTSAGSGLRVAGVITAAAGVAVLAGAMALNLKHNGMISDLKDDYSLDTADSASGYKTLAIVGYGVGAACVAGGALLYGLGWRAGRAQVAPAVVAGNAGLVMAGSF